MFNRHMQSQIDRLVKKVEELEERLTQTEEDECKGCEIQVGTRDMTDTEKDNCGFHPLLVFGRSSLTRAIYTVPVMMPTSKVVKMIMQHQGIEFNHTPVEVKTRLAETKIIKKVKPSENKKSGKK